MAKKKPEWWDSKYPVWKKIAWRVVRVFVVAALPVLGFMLSSVTVEDLQCKENLTKWLVSGGLAIVAAGLAGVGKWLREQYPDNYIVSRLPF